MHALYDYLWRYSMAVNGGIVGHCEWAEQTAKDERGHRRLVFGPLGSFTIVMLMCKRLGTAP